MKAMYSGFYIISGCTKTHDRTSELISMLKQDGCVFKPVVGCWEGNKEQSFLVIGQSEEYIKTLAKFFNQEAVLFCDCSRDTFLQFVDGSELYIGQFNEISEEQAKQTQCYTYDNGRYFLASL